MATTDLNQSDSSSFGARVWRWFLAIGAPWSPGKAFKHATAKVPVPNK